MRSEFMQAIKFFRKVVVHCCNAKFREKMWLGRSPGLTFCIRARLKCTGKRRKIIQMGLREELCTQGDERGGCKE